MNMPSSQAPSSERWEANRVNMPPSQHSLNYDADIGSPEVLQFRKGENTCSPNDGVMLHVNALLYVRISGYCEHPLNHGCDRCLCASCTDTRSKKQSRI